MKIVAGATECDMSDDKLSNILARRAARLAADDAAKLKAEREAKDAADREATARAQWDPSERALRQVIERLNTEMSGHSLSIKESTDKLGHSYSPAICHLSFSVHGLPDRQYPRMMINVSRFGLVQVSTMRNTREPSNSEKLDLPVNEATWRQLIIDFLDTVVTE